MAIHRVPRSQCTPLPGPGKRRLVLRLVSPYLNVASRRCSQAPRRLDQIGNTQRPRWTIQRPGFAGNRGMVSPPQTPVVITYTSIGSRPNAAGSGTEHRAGAEQ